MQGTWALIKTTRFTFAFLAASITEIFVSPFIKTCLSNACLENVGIGGEPTEMITALVSARMNKSGSFASPLIHSTFFIHSSFLPFKLGVFLPVREILVQKIPFLAIFSTITEPTNPVPP
jgi:hypothetical protein